MAGRLLDMGEIKIEDVAAHLLELTARGIARYRTAACCCDRPRAAFCGGSLTPGNEDASHDLLPQSGWAVLRLWCASRLVGSDGFSAAGEAAHGENSNAPAETGASRIIVGRRASHQTKTSKTETTNRSHKSLEALGY